MSLTVPQARDEMSAIFHTEWEASSFAAFEVRWDDVGEPAPTSRSPWARFTIRHADGGNASISNYHFRRKGTVFVQLFAPTGEGLSRLDQMGMVALAAFEGRATPGGVWFREVRLREIGVDGNWQQVNVLADFEYDEIR